MIICYTVPSGAEVDINDVKEVYFSDDREEICFTTYQDPETNFLDIKKNRLIGIIQNE